MTALSNDDLSTVYGGVTGDTIKDWNGYKYTEYQVKAGDCLSLIAQHYDTTLAALQKLNPEIVNPDLIEIGQVIRIPYTV